MVTSESTMLLISLDTIAPGPPPALLRAEPPAEWSGWAEVVVADLRAAGGVARVAATAPDAVIHLAAVASSAAVRQDPIAAWTLNAGATAALSWTSLVPDL